ncbi:hypothetical protein LP414_04575 [Polaromonas sp. P1(28)-13]|nr:hypothetical protein LP417_25250 [Polaromonas sp. P1-6]UUZ76795.1 hypothetical protein LP414_04575 [Polaromonas sp. P1(28)-13]
MNLQPLPSAVYGALKSSILILGAAVLLLAAVLPAGAADQPAAPPGGHPPGPPPEAVAACKGKAEGAQASFTNRGGHAISGTCQRIGNELAAMPASGPGAARPASAPSR